MNAKRKMSLKMLLYSLTRRRSRIIIALLSVIVGSTILSGLLMIYYDVPRQMSIEFRNYGANVILSPDGDNYLSDENVDKALTYFPNNSIEGCTPYRYENSQINNVPVTTAGVDFSSVKKTSPYWAVEGDLPSKNKEALIGAKVASTFDFKVGDSFKIVSRNIEITDEIAPLLDEDDFVFAVDDISYVTRELKFDVVGILDTGSKEEEYIYLNFADVTYINIVERGYDIAELSISGQSSDLDGYISAVNNANIGIKAKTVKRVVASEATVLTKLQFLVFIVTVVVLALTIICVITTMMAVVAERRKEIGLRKSLGASNKDIATEFILEGVIIGGVAGIFGAVLGYVFALVVSLNVFSTAITFRPLLIPITIVASIIITVLSSLIPVRTAVKVEPALVLKGE